ncbi:hypothetical protein PR003_g33881 [Phytophthora rubi]|uniref:Uncharacterized protein n=1 Tax=Phytophthora rubi TaxID=129364 RepID=A0A6A3L191_9STRA|nr:hypothetical protein PR002_g14979 [Phytophthora rubi]KAE9261566.1 hypothetical protein PR003_g33881 [Phytophthora rubi]
MLVVTFESTEPFFPLSGSSPQPVHVLSDAAECSFLAVG